MELRRRSAARRPPADEQVIGDERRAANQRNGRAAGRLKVMMSALALPLALRIAWRGVPAPLSAALVMANWIAQCRR